MVLRVSVPFPVVLFGKEERPNTELAEKSLLPAGFVYLLFTQA
jgi:hypothetical protein